MKTVCQKCGVANDLGHLFCVSCATKLELSNIGEDIERDGAASQRRAVLKILWIPPVAIIVALVAIIVWPQRPYASISGQPGSRTRVDEMFTVLHRYAQRPSGSIRTRPALTQDDLNAWLASQCPAAGVHSITLSMANNGYSVRVIDSVGPFKIRDYTIPALKYSYEIAGTIEDGLTIHSTGGKIGHFPLFGPAVTKLDQRIGKILATDQRILPVLEKTTRIQIDDGTLEITVTAAQGN
jgi:hypothetical protein